MSFDKKCFDGKMVIQPCCDRKISRSCHFKDGIDFNKMRNDYHDYKEYESKYRDQAKTNTFIMKKIINMREKWLHKYYRPECRKCDNNGINHDGYIQNLNDSIRKQVPRTASKTRRTKRTSSIRSLSSKRRSNGGHHGRSTRRMKVKS